MDKVAALKKTDLFKRLNDDELLAVAGLCREASYARGEHILEEGSAGDDLYILPQGRVGVDIRISDDLYLQRAHEVLRGEVFGELAIFGHQRTARVSALEAVRLYAISVKRLKKLMTDQPRIGFIVLYNLGDILAERLMMSNINMRGTLSRQASQHLPSDISRREKLEETRNQTFMRLFTMQVAAGDLSTSAETAKEITDPVQRADALLTVAEAYQQKGDDKKSAALMEEARKAAKDISL